MAPAVPPFLAPWWSALRLENQKQMPLTEQSQVSLWDLCPSPQPVWLLSVHEVCVAA
jgi:hypothetical protein